MKKIMFMLLLGTATGIYAQDIVIPYTQVPNVGKTFINTHFGANEVKTVEMEKSTKKTEYEIYLNSGAKVELDSKGNWKEVDGKGSPIPTAFISNNILTYVKTNYSSEKIVKIDRDSKKTEVKLSNGTELEFSPKGKFLRIDN